MFHIYFWNHGRRKGQKLEYVIWLVYKLMKISIEYEGKSGRAEYWYLQPSEIGRARRVQHRDEGNATEVWELLVPSKSSEECASWTEWYHFLLVGQNMKKIRIYFLVSESLPFIIFILYKYKVMKPTFSLLGTDTLVTTPIIQGRVFSSLTSGHMFTCLLLLSLISDILPW